MYLFVCVPGLFEPCCVPPPVLGGSYSEKDAGAFDNGIIWVTWHDRWYSLKETTMKIIPVSRINVDGQQQSGVKQFGGL